MDSAFSDSDRPRQARLNDRRGKLWTHTPTLAAVFALYSALSGCSSKKSLHTVEPFDSGTTADAGLDANMTGDAQFMEEAGPPDRCETDAAPPACDILTNAGCNATLELCLTGGCNSSGYCERKGATCRGQSAVACPTGSSCEPATGDGVCVAASATDCVDSRTCPFGYQCETSIDFPDRTYCVDRRVACTPPGGCPSGYTCKRPGNSGGYFCVRTLVPCEDNPGICGDLACVALFGTSAKFCYPQGACSSNDDCNDPSAPTCDVSLSDGTSVCGNGGPCQSAADCVSGQMCVDVHNDSFKHCRWPGNACQRDADCSAREFCVNRTGAQSTRCAEGS